ncbi:uncharacterized protein LOC144621900 [Crassostrea virginica]
MERDETDIKTEQIYFKWREERLKVIEKLTEIKDGIQRVADVYNTASAAYSGVGIAGTALTVGSLILTPFFPPAGLVAAAGAVTGAASGVADITHGAIKYKVIQDLCTEAEKISEDHDKTGMELIKWLDILYEKLTAAAHVAEKGAKGLGIAAKGHTALKHVKAVKIYRGTGSAAKAAKALKIGRVMQKVLPNAAQEVVHGVRILSKGAIRGFAFVSVVFDIHNIYSSVSKLSKGELCNEAAKLEGVIKKLEKEMEEFSEIFE